MCLSSPNSGLGPIQSEGWGFKSSHPGTLGSRDHNAPTRLGAASNLQQSLPLLPRGPGFSSLLTENSYILVFALLRD